ncbi:hypothetical protein KIW84_065926 [Lathyrus oleraceus]|uniref:Reverse transcriptase/retrotransposon-derived protein RNase H-like domain-containing protein n=1 Tax=Pisum sativum TaxID=3888 RepID=A0A9D4WI59_PEA|nr:hypothetical protein KIW84_065926 [Pisum sativum]
MMSIFTDYLNGIMEVFMDDLSVCGFDFENCLINLEKILERCVKVNLVLSWEKCHFMVKEGIVLGHIISERGIEVDKAKIEVIENLNPPKTVREVRSFLGHAGFYRRFIKDFYKIIKPLTDLLMKDVEFIFNEKCIKAFNRLKQALISASILQTPNWTQPFEIMCDASNFAIGAVLGQRKDKKFQVSCVRDGQAPLRMENFDTMPVIFRDPVQEQRYAMVSQRPMSPTRYPDSTCIEALGIEPSVRCSGVFVTFRFID